MRTWRSFPEDPGSPGRCAARASWDTRAAAAPSAVAGVMRRDTSVVRVVRSADVPERCSLHPAEE
ncbi:hypothetical protein SALBM217S_03411 [Streptomyces griseoloalbus]